VAVLLIAYLGASFVLYRQLTTVLPHCNGKFAENTPAAFSGAPFNADLDTTPYLMPNYQSLEIPSREAGIMLSAWYIPAANASAPAVLVTHGLGVGTADCKHNPRALLAAGMLHAANYNVLMIDVRQHGDSTITTGRWAANTREYLDTLGAWDWLVNTQGFAPARVGLFGYSGGTGATLIAMGEEPRAAAAWLDSPYYDLSVSVTDRLQSEGYPTWLAPGGYLIARLYGDDLFAKSPVEAVTKLNMRPVFVVHSADDPTLPSRYGQALVDAIRATGDPAELWILPGTQHVGEMFDFPAEYAQKLTAFFGANLS
jgi:dipeptidyl aminopeptidase/acylaminoacyl peptidase